VLRGNEIVLVKERRSSAGRYGRIFQRAKDANFVAEGFADALLVAILCKNITTVALLIKVFLFKLFSC